MSSKPFAFDVMCPCCFRPGVPLCENFTAADSEARLAGLRSLLTARQLGGYVVPSGDAHSSEYVSTVDSRREWLTGFTGSAGIALVTHEHALLWTDGRYFVQAAAQLAGGPWTLMKMHEPGVPSLEEWVAKQQSALPGPIAIDPALATISAAKAWTDKKCEPWTLVDSNLVDEIWRPKPARSSEPVVPLSLALTGETVASKLARVSAALAESGCNAMVINALDQICWLFNIRGADIQCNPVCYAYAVVARAAAAPAAAVAAAGSAADGCVACDESEGELRAVLYLRALDGEGVEGKMAEMLRSHLRSEGCGGSEGEGVSVQLQRYADFNAAEAWRAVGAGQSAPRVMLERATCTLAMAAAVPVAARSLVDVGPVERLKALKNDAEIAGIVRAGERDAAAIVSYFSWLEEALRAGTPVSEAEGADEIQRRRAAMQGAVGDSFPTISSSGANAGVIHYQAEHGKDKRIDPTAIYLCDTGGQYLDGTTDVTRTLHFGEPNVRERRAYTRVLQGHIALAVAVFPAGTPGMMLDCLARAPLWKDGMNYMHGTGHGIGAYLNVHEGPFGVGGGATHAEKLQGSERLRMYTHGIEQGYHLSNEPGFYLDGVEGAFGVRLESDLIVEKAETLEAWGPRPYLCFKYCTPVPFCRSLIEVGLLSADEVRWLDGFHAACRKAITPSLLEEAAAAATGDRARDLSLSIEWLERATMPLGPESVA